MFSVILYRTKVKCCDATCFQWLNDLNVTRLWVCCFDKPKVETIELTIKERIYFIIIEMLTKIYLEIDFELDFLFEHIYTEYQQFAKTQNYKKPDKAA